MGLFNRSNLLEIEREPVEEIRAAHLQSAVLRPDYETFCTGIDADPLSWHCLGCDGDGSFRR